MKLLLSVLATVFLTIASATDPYPRNEALDIQHYQFRIELNDSTNLVAGEASITVLFKKPVTSFEFDLVEKGIKGFGMTVTEVRLGGRNLPFTHQQERLKILLDTPSETGTISTFVIRYAGIPEDGLIISNNKFGDRTFFGDNWPDRGHHWLPCIDHPSDKATVEFVIVAPDKYDVVASGKRKEETSLTRNQKLTRYLESIPIAVKVMAIGVARFATEETAEVDHIPQSTWVYPQNRDAGFHDFAVGTKIFEYFQRNIGPYSYEKLAHVQSKTRWGGLENAGNIFYTESSVTGKGLHEGLIAHETAHQWFGNSVTENDWHHVWLSEGFATYFAALYTEHAHGQEAFVAEMNKSRATVVAYYRTNPNPVIDTTIVEISKVLNTNTYPKAGWVLHMLRHEIGDESFWKGIQEYYLTFKDKHVMTRDFQASMEKASRKNLGQFFHQWLYIGGHPQLEFNWKLSRKEKGIVSLTISQKQQRPFQFPLDVHLVYPDGSSEQKTVMLSKSTEQIMLDVKGLPKEVLLDPGSWLLFEVKTKK